MNPLKQLIAGFQRFRERSFANAQFHDLVQFG